MNSIQSIVILGGGSAGWMAATYLQRILCGSEPAIEITVVESADIPTVGVGEATVPSIRSFFELIEVSEIDLFVKTNATIKNAIRFDNWLHGQGERYFHPFEFPAISDGIEVGAHWVASAMNQPRSQQQFAYDTGVIPQLCDSNKVVKLFESPPYEAPTSYAYHLDAALLGKFLRDVALSRGVKRIEDTVAQVELDAQGNVQHLVTQGHGNVGADFFVDCTGFAGVIIEKALGAEFHAYSDELLCDRAVAMPTTHTDADNLASYTIADAAPAGWRWAIDLSSRRGNGYVYSSAFTDETQAEDYLRAQAGASDNSQSALHLRMRVGRRENFWHKNCLALGLAGGFIEPLESTGLQFIEAGLRLFFDHFPARGENPTLSARYNTVMREMYDEVKDFIVLHYILTRREDTPFWQACKHDLKASDDLAAKLELWRTKLPSPMEFPLHGLFCHYNYMYVLAGMDRLVPDSMPFLKGLDSRRSEFMLAEVRNIQAQARDVSPTQRDYVTRVCAPFTESAA